MTSQGTHKNKNLYIENIYSLTNTTVNFQDPLNIASDSGTILFQNGVEIGNTATTSTDTGVAIGKGANVTGLYGVAIGHQTSASGNNVVAIGQLSLNSATGDNNIGIGENSGATIVTGNNNICIGPNADVVDSDITDSVSIGTGATANTNAIAIRGTASGLKSVSIGVSSISTNEDNISIGFNADATGSSGSMAIGTNTVSSGQDSIAIGRTTRATANYAISIGDSNAGNIDAIAIGQAINSLAVAGIAIGRLSRCSSEATYGVSIGRLARGNAMSTVALGNEAYAYAPYAISIGNAAKVFGENGIGIGVTSRAHGENNIAIGSAARALGGAKNAIAIGRLAGFPGGLGNYGIAIGRNSLINNTSAGISNVGIGLSAGSGITTGSYNTCLGRSTGSSNMTGSKNVIIGFSSDCTASDTESAVAIGDDCVSGTSGVAIGDGTVCGDSAIAIGLTAQANASDSIAIGRLSGNAGLGNASVAIGREALEASTAPNNVAIGHQSLNLNTTGNCNVALGAYAGDAIITGNANTFIGESTDVHVSTANECIAIGYAAVATGNGYVQIGQASKYSAGNAQIKFRTQIIADESWIGGSSQFAGIDNGGNIFKTDIDITTLSPPITTQYLTGSRTGVGNVTLTDSTTGLKPTIPTDTHWTITIDVTGVESGDLTALFSEKQFARAVNVSGTTTATLISQSTLDSGSLVGDIVTLTGNTTDLDVVITTGSSGTTNWSASMIVTPVS